MTAVFRHVEETTVAAAELFGLFVRPALALALVPAAGLELVAGPASGVLAVGDTVTLRTRRHGLSQQVVHRVEAVEEPRRIVVVQARGPLKAYRLEQVFEPTDAGTRLVEEVTFGPPGGVLGLVLTEERLRGEFAELYALRRAAFAERGWLA